MKMSDVKVGMKLACEAYYPFSSIIVTEVNAEGFVYSTEGPPIHYRGGQMFAKDGHTHFGYNGWTDYEPVILPLNVSEMKVRRLIHDLAGDNNFTVRMLLRQLVRVYSHRYIAAALDDVIRDEILRRSGCS